MTQLVVISNVGHENLVHGNMFVVRRPCVVVRLHCNHTSCGIFAKEKAETKQRKNLVGAEQKFYINLVLLLLLINID